MTRRGRDVKDILIRLRLAMFEAMGYAKDVLIQAIDPMRKYFQEYLPSGSFRLWVAKQGCAPITNIGLVIHSLPPSPNNLVGKEACVMNLVTLPEF